MTEQHPITPPPLELVDTWEEEANQSGKPRLDYIATEEEANQSGKPRLDYIATQAARWGADQELEACEEWMRSHFHGVPQWADQLRAARRPKPPSLAEQAQRILVENGTTLDGRIELDPDDIITIRAALERLQELEGKQ